MRVPWRRRPRPLSCAEVAALLQAYLDDETDKAATRRVADHLEDCLRCGMEEDTYRLIKEALARRPPELDPDAIARLRAFGERLATPELDGAPGPAAN